MLARGARSWSSGGALGHPRLGAAFPPSWCGGLGSAHFPTGQDGVGLVNAAESPPKVPGSRDGGPGASSEGTLWGHRRLLCSGWPGLLHLSCGDLHAMIGPMWLPGLSWMTGQLGQYFPEWPPFPKAVGQGCPGHTRTQPAPSHSSC